MFKKGVKYTAVDKSDLPHEVETVEFEPMRRKICSPACLWSSLFTGVLIGTYYIPSVGLTFYQRWLLQRFPFPLLTVLVHMFVKYLLASMIRFILIKRQNKQRTVIGWKEYVTAVAPTGLFSGIDIGFSNWGLELITVSLYTMTKSTTIVFILFFSILFKLEKKSWSLVGIVFMITTGLILFTYKSTQFSVFGFTLLLFASISSGLRWTCVQLLLQKSKMGMNNPVDMIYHMQPWMIASVLPFAIWNEGFDVVRSCQVFGFTNSSEFAILALKVLLGALIAFFMELSEVMLVTYTSSLTLAIAGIFKEVFILGLAVEVNGDVMSPINIVGLLVCLCGISFHVVHKLKTAPNKNPVRGYNAAHEKYELSDYLMEDDLTCDLSSDDDKSDTQVLFDILNREKRI
ncbi:solute carrier family 35 member C2 isoform X2 [Cylas formicarius]|uniref:solute carrier family 35 member C2 isoform X2 n=1 Tax=Cylas formicarius TaxID=197179 RepID=UPI002958983E|nr:solute carrier family 35 member C2 isoform X2 [Cylas formicarius]